MASVTVTPYCFFGSRNSKTFSIYSPAMGYHGVIAFNPFCKTNVLKLSFSHHVSGFPSVFSSILHKVVPICKFYQPLTIVAAKDYKMKTHKASAKRFRVTGTGKIIRRRAGKQHLLKKKSRKRKLRLSKMTLVSKKDYNNVIGAMPYLKVNRLAK